SAATPPPGSGCFITVPGPDGGPGTSASFTQGGVSGQCPAVVVAGLGPPALGGAGGDTQIIDSRGAVALTPGEAQSLPVSQAALQLAASGQPAVLFESATVNA